MEEQRFDRWTRMFAVGASRRATTQSLTMALAALPIALGREEAAAGCTRLGKKCDDGDECCGGGRCKGRRCVCAGGKEEINGACFARGNCTNGAEVCDGKCGNAPSGGLHRGCYCGTTTEGTTTCFKNQSLCLRLCATSADCPAGRACFATTCEEDPPGTCMKPCPDEHTF
jgi:hypothetical protein